MNSQAVVHEYAEDYDVALNQGLAATGEGKDYFARSLVEWLARRLRDLPESVRRVMDYECGDGSSSVVLLKLLGASP